MRTEELVSQIYQISEKLLQLLSYEIKGKTVGSWLTLALKFSFVIWIGIVLWQSYSFYVEYKKLQQQISNKKNILTLKKHRLKNLQLKLQDIEIAYSHISQIFSKREVQRLKKNINTAFRSMEKHDSIFNPVRYESFNYRFHLNPQIFSSIKTVALNDLIFRSSITDYFRNSLYKELRKFWESKEENKKGSIQLTLKKSTIVMFFSFKGNNIYIKSLSHIGFIKNIYAPNIFLETSFIPYEALKNGLNYSPLYVGWDFSLK